MTKVEATRILKSKMDGNVDTSYEWAEAVRMAIEALIKESKMVSREILEQVMWERDTAVEQLRIWVTKMIEIQKASTIDIDRPQGKWKQAENVKYAVCTNCKCHGNFYMRYCPNCGARMEVGGE